MHAYVRVYNTRRAGQYMHTSMCVYVCVCTYICIYVYMYMYICIYIYRRSIHVRGLACRT